MCKPRMRRAAPTCRRPTFLFGAELDSGDTDDLPALLDVPIAKLLHGEQIFTFHRSACAGGTITVSSEIGDITLCAAIGIDNRHCTVRYAASGN